MEIKLQPVGFVSTSVKEQSDENWGFVTSRIILAPEFIGGLLGLEEFSHAIIVTFLHQAKYRKEAHLKRPPRGLESMPEVGIFSQRAKDRPNPIGITAVKIVSVGNDHLDVQGLDAIDQTPILDIKPYYPHYDNVQISKIPDWVNRLMENYF
jgi:tRNA (adenine37-N6)-methyltransferase